MPGNQKVLWVAQHTRPGPETPLESLARATIVLAGLPEPEPQVWIKTRLGEFRVDLLDRGNRVVTEADGTIKYSTEQDVWREKRRQDAIRDQGFEVTRYTMADHQHPEQWLPGYRRAIRRSRRTYRRKRS